MELRTFIIQSTDNYTNSALFKYCAKEGYGCDLELQQCVTPNKVPLCDRVIYP